MQDVETRMAELMNMSSDIINSILNSIGTVMKMAYNTLIKLNQR